ncbi:PAS-domain containing protein [Rhizobium sp. AG855]|uniref:sensor histidine kinase n=1 Tax=Rhizobium sp. AG855 TaxID=2183898 RepID=UPI000E712326|nr:PAS-domain containing protein [Rhizobium sp. AG855]RKE85928.1 PAS domain S-box-containing protein [Rhizobium sp. AG855]
MQTMTWNDLPVWALLADRDILRAATPERRLTDVLTDVSAVITTVTAFDLMPAFAVYLADSQHDRDRLFHQNAADELSLPLDICPDQGLPPGASSRSKAATYPLTLHHPSGGRMGTVLFFGRTGKRMSQEKLAILRMLSEEIGTIIAHRNGCTGTLLDMVELSTDEIYVFDPQSLQITRANATASVRTGYSAQALSAMTPAELKAGVSEADYRARLVPLMLGRAQKISFDTIQRRRNGTVYPVKVHVWRIKGQESDLFAEVAIATADQRKAFGLLEQVFDAIPGGIGVFDNRSRLLMANRRLYDLMNIPPELFPPGSAFEDILRYNACRGEWGDGDHEAMVRERVEQAELGLPYSFERERTSGKVLAVRSEPLSNGGYVLSYTDITVRKRAEKDLIRNRDELEKTVRQRTAEIAAQAAALEEALQQEKNINAMQRQFVAMTSHEFRTPLAIIDGAAQRLLRKKGGIDAAFLGEKTQQIRSAVARMVELMESFLSAGRMETGKAELSLVDCALHKLVEQAIKRQKLSSPHHRFETDIDALPPMIRCDALGISQVITNLLSNAIKYAPRAPDILIRGWEEEGFVFLSVRDEGVGIDAEDIDKLFQPYFRARTSTGIAGTGIGLSLVKQIVTLHDGDIFVESQRGKGTTFTLVLPVKGPARASETEAAAETHAA